MEEKFVYRVQGYYDMDICKDEEIVSILYDNEESAKAMVKYLIAEWKKNGYTKDECDSWDETETSLYAYLDSEWNVDIFYKKQRVLTDFNGHSDLNNAVC